MSLMRLALRAATVSALSAAPHPTIAGPLVFDSKMDPIEHTAEETALPCLLVYTDRDEAITLDRGNGRTFRERQILLVIEAVIASFSGQSVTFIETDAELEAMLDLFEWQVWRTLNDPYSAAARPWQALVKRTEDWKSEPGRSANKTSRMAVRQIHISCIVNNDCLPAALALPPGARAELPEPASLLDAPYLAPLEEALRTNPSFAGLVEQLREARTGVPSRAVPVLTTIGWRLNNPQPDGTPSPDVIFTAR